MSGALFERVSAAPSLSQPCVHAAARTYSRRDLLEQGFPDEMALSGRSVLVHTQAQLITAQALVRLDGVARRLILCPPGLTQQQRLQVVVTGEVDAIVTDDAASVQFLPAPAHIATPAKRSVRAATQRTPATEWVLLTSGTTGTPKLVVHSLSSLCGAIGKPADPPPLWATFYDIRRYGGLQIFLRALAGGGAVILPDPEETLTGFLLRAGKLGLTHMTGTPSHWRHALMSGAGKHIHPGYVRLSGEIVDQAILDKLKLCYPDAKIVHAFASTEAGVAFEVTDGFAGFPADMLDASHPDVALKVEDGTLQIRSGRAASRILGTDRPARRRDGFVDTGDAVERRGERYHFIGREDGTINVGGNKIHPEEVEAAIASHPDVEMARARTRRNSILGAIIEADVVLREGNDGPSGQDIVEFCKTRLDRHKVPSSIRILSALPLTPAGKMDRTHG